MRSLRDGYIIYKCLTCNKIFILMTNDVDHSERESRYISCPYFGKHKNIIVCGKFDSIKEVMEDQRMYEKRKGRVRQK